jgi:hypothetical protein
MKMRLFNSKEPEKVNQDEEKKFESTKDHNADPEVMPAEQIDPVIEKRVRRKLDTHIVPLLSALYLLAFLDRSNIGYARDLYTGEHI